MDTTQANIIGTSVSIILPAVLFYFTIQKNIRKSILFAVVFAGLSEILLALFKIFGLENSIPISTTFGLIILFFIIVLGSVFLSLNIMSEKAKIQQILIVSGIYIAIIGVLAFSLFKNIDTSLLMSKN